MENFAIVSGYCFRSKEVVCVPVSVLTVWPENQMRSDLRVSRGVSRSSIVIRCIAARPSFCGELMCLVQQCFHGLMKGRNDSNIP